MPEGIDTIQHNVHLIEYFRTDLASNPQAEIDRILGTVIDTFSIAPHKHKNIDPEKLAETIKMNLMETFSEKMSQQKSKVTVGVTTFDGPPFANGIMHLGHYLAGAIKDTLYRFQASRAKRDGVELPVPRFGWDCHGLPIEQAAEKIIKSIITDTDENADISMIPVELVNKIRKQIRNREADGDEVLSASDLANLFSTDVINEICFALIKKTQNHWADPVKKSGRIIDMKNPIATKDFSYMNTIWQVFAKLDQLGLVDMDGNSVLPYSPMGTAISNSEATSSDPIKTDDITVTIKFKLEPKEADELTTYFIAWTTTPWSLPANTALAVDTSLSYIAVTHEGEKYILSKASFEKYQHYFSNHTVEEINISNYVHRTYEPIFTSYNKTQGKYFIVDASNLKFVNDGKGTGVVHIAPAFGKEDYELYKNNQDKMTVVDHMDTYLKIQGQLYCAPSFIEGLLEQLGKAVLLKELLSIEHKVCPRTKQPLINRACSSVMLKARDIHNDLINSAQEVIWHTPAAKNMFDASNQEPHDWCISRNRRFGTPIPVWYAQDGTRLVISSADHFKTLTGISLDNLHLIGHEHFENIVVEGKSFKRVNFAFDCWFESGCLPYALQADAFTALMNNNRVLVPADILPFTADFVAEGLDQVRGWFYSLLFLSSALFKAPVFRSVLANGMVQGEDGKKMSKSLGNYKAVQDILEPLKSPDALRFFLLKHGQSGENFSYHESAVEKSSSLIKTLEESLSYYMIRSKEDKKQAPKEHPICLKARIQLEYLIIKLNRFLDAKTDKLSLFDACTAVEEFIQNDLSKGFIGAFKEQPHSVYNPSNELALILHTLGKLIEPLVPLTADKIGLAFKDLPSNEMSGYPQAGWLLNEIPEVDQQNILSKYQKASDWVKKIKAAVDLAREKNKALKETPLLYIVLPDLLKSDLDFLYHTKSAYRSLAEKLNVLEIRFKDDYVQPSVVRQLVDDVKILKEINSKKVKITKDPNTGEVIYSLKGSFEVHFKGEMPSDINQEILSRIKHAFQENNARLDMTDPKLSLEHNGIKLEPSFLKKHVTNRTIIRTRSENEIGVPIKDSKHIIVLSTNITNPSVQTEKALQIFRSRITEIRLKELTEDGTNKKLLATDSLQLYLSKEDILQWTPGIKLSDYPFVVESLNKVVVEELYHLIKLKLPHNDLSFKFYVAKEYCPSSSPLETPLSMFSMFAEVTGQDPSKSPQKEDTVEYRGKTGGGGSKY
jgi:isoleucyl-tRNA synthetase